MVDQLQQQQKQTLDLYKAQFDQLKQDYIRKCKQRFSKQYRDA